MREKRDRLHTGLILVAFGVCLYCLLQNFGSVSAWLSRMHTVIYPLLLGFALAFVFNVLMSPLERLLKRIPALQKYPKLTRVIALVLTLLGAAALVALVALVVAPRTGEAISMFVTVLPQSATDLTNAIQEFLQRFHASDEIMQQVSAYISGLTQQVLTLIKESTGTIANYVLNTVVSALNTVVNIVFAVIVAIYVLYGKERIGRFTHRLMLRFLPEKVTSNVIRVANLSYTTFANFVRGQLIQALILGVLCFIGMLIFGFPYAAVVSLLVGVTSLIPMIGAWLGGAISVILVAAIEPFQGLMLAIFIAVLQQFSGNVIYPRVVGSTIGLPGLLVMAAIIIGQGLAGFAGILIAVPLCAVGYTLLKQKLNEKPQTTDDRSEASPCE
jgi:predicted PurR-regulated permease PerM